MAKARHDKTELVRENAELVEVNPKGHQEDHDRHNRVKTGGQRLDKRSAQGVSGLPKKSGQGGKFTWGDPRDDASMEDSTRVLDKKDPNYVDEGDEEFIEPVASKSVEVPASENSAESQEKA